MKTGGGPQQGGTTMSRDTVLVICPYCGNKNKVQVQGSRPVVVLCDYKESFGCDQYFVVEVEWVAKITVYTLDKEPVDTDSDKLKRALLRIFSWHAAPWDARGTLANLLHEIAGDIGALIGEEDANRV